VQSIDDSTLISTNSSFRNTLFFNRSNPRYGLDGTWQRVQNKSLLVNGFESRAQTSFSANVRWSLTAAFLFTANGTSGDKTNRSDFFSERSYNILFNSLEPKLSWQPDASSRISVSYTRTSKENVLPESGGEKSEGNSINLEGKYSTVRTGILSVRASLINLQYNGETNSALAYEMLEGLTPGRNYTWGAAAQRNLGNAMQLSLNYEGRKSPGAGIVHIGGMQFRAFF
jgi:hypothetical protein